MIIGRDPNTLPKRMMHHWPRLPLLPMGFSQGTKNLYEEGAHRHFVLPVRSPVEHVCEYKCELRPMLIHALYIPWVDCYLHYQNI